MARPKKTKEAEENNNDGQELNEYDTKLELALTSIRKKFKDEAMQLLGGSGLDIVYNSTGITSVDRALGGGFAEGRPHEIFGPESGGKCLVSDTMIATDNGIKTIEEIFIENGITPSCTTKVTPKSIKLINRYGKLENTKNFTNNGKRKIIKINTNSGNEIKSTQNHPHLVMSEMGNLVWRKTIDLKLGDYLVLPRFGSFGSKSRDLEEMYLLGCMTADAYFGKNKICITNNDQSVKNSIENKSKELIGVAPKRYPTNNESDSVDFHFNSKLHINNFYNLTGIKQGIAKDKEIPVYIRESNKESIRNFLKGYFDCECHIDSRHRRIEVLSASKKLIMQTKLLLQQFGIISTINIKKVKNYEHNDYWRLTISGEEAIKYKNIIGTNSKNRLEALSQISNTTNGSTNIDSIPNMGNLLKDLYDSCETHRHENKLLDDYMGPNPSAKLTYDRLEKILKCESFKECKIITDHLTDLYNKNYFYDPIVGIEELGEEPTFDFEMEETSSFVANGIITHNTTLALKFIAEMQKKGKVAAFIDMEHALDPKWASTIGVNVDKLLCSQPDSAEEALSMIEILVRSEMVDLIVLDSVAALVTEKELAGEMGESIVGGISKLMSQAMRKLTGASSKSKTTVILINQIREKIGVTYGSNETTPGGRALRFAATTRVEVRRVETIKENDVDVANKVKVKVVKNKVAPPFRVAEYDIRFDSGIDTVKDLIECAVSDGIIIKSGSWYEYNGNKHQGVNKFKEALKNDNDLLEEIKSKLN